MENVILTEETDWIGGQIDRQAVPPDENAVDRERRLHATLLATARGRSRLLPAAITRSPTTAKNDPKLNPGGGGVSPICHEPRVSLAVLEADARAASHERARAGDDASQADRRGCRRAIACARSRFTNLRERTRI